eukprot:gene22999-29185_t
MFDKIPVRDTYKDTRDQAIKLLGPARLVRALFIIEVMFFSVTFALSYYYDNLDVCSDNHRDDYIISVTGLAANDDNCLDILLSDNYRFCYGSEASVSIDDETTTTTQFPRQTDKPAATFSTSYFFTNSSGSVHTISAPFTPDTLKTDFVTDNAHNVFVIAKSTTDQQQYLYMLSPYLSSAQVLQRVSFNAFYGLVYGNNRVYSYTLTGSSGTIFAYNLLTSAYSSMAVDCSDYITSGSTAYSASTTYRFISHDKSSDLLYAMCTSDTSVSTTVIVQGQPPTTTQVYVFAFHEVDFVAGTTRAISANLHALNDTNTNEPLTSITQVLVSGDVAVAFTGSSGAQIISIDLTTQPTSLPTPSPTSIPVNSPTRVPTPSVPVPPTPAVPSAVPTNIPSISPSLGLSQQYYAFSVNQALSGISSTTYNSNLAASNAIFQQTVADVISGLNSSDVTVNSVSSTATTHMMKITSAPTATPSQTPTITLRPTQTVTQMPSITPTQVVTQTPSTVSTNSGSPGGGGGGGGPPSFAPSSPSQTAITRVPTTQSSVSFIVGANSPTATPVHSDSPSPSVTANSLPPSSDTNSQTPSAATMKLKPTVMPSGQVMDTTLSIPSLTASVQPSAHQSAAPSAIPSVTPTTQLTFNPSLTPSQRPSLSPTTSSPSDTPTTAPSAAPSELPSVRPSASPSLTPSWRPSAMPSTRQPSLEPSLRPSVADGDPTSAPVTTEPSTAPTVSPSETPSHAPTERPSTSPSVVPSLLPSLLPSLMPFDVPSERPTANPSPAPSEAPSAAPTDRPTEVPSTSPSTSPTSRPSAHLSASPSWFPTNGATRPPSVTPTQAVVTKQPTVTPTGGQQQGTAPPGNGGSGAPPPNPNTGRKLADNIAHRRLALNTNPVYQPAFVVGSLNPTGGYLVSGYGSTVYVSGNNNKYINATTALDMSIDEYLDFRGDYFYSTTVQLGYSYSVCNGNNTHYTVDPSCVTDFYSQCGEKNGAYYQNNKFFSISSSCAGTLDVPSSATISDLLSCEDVAVLYSNFTTVNCADSFESVCTIAYTDNPPFSCSKDVHSSFLSIFANAFSNASFVTSVLIIVIHFGLKRLYPDGVSFTRHIETAEGLVEVNEDNKLVSPELVKMKERDVIAHMRNMQKAEKYGLSSSVKQDISTAKAKGVFRRKKTVINKADNTSNNSSTQNSVKMSSDKGSTFTAGFKALFKSTKSKPPSNKEVDEEENEEEHKEDSRPESTSRSIRLETSAQNPDSSLDAVTDFEKAVEAANAARTPSTSARSQTALSVKLTPRNTAAGAQKDQRQSPRAPLSVSHRKIDMPDAMEGLNYSKCDEPVINSMASSDNSLVPPTAANACNMFIREPPSSGESGEQQSVNEEAFPDPLGVEPSSETTPVTPFTPQTVIVTPTSKRVLSSLLNIENSVSGVSTSPQHQQGGGRGSAKSLTTKRSLALVKNLLSDM